MRFLRWSIGAWVVLLLAGSAAARGAYNCLPTCDSTDARFLAIANGASFITLSQPTLELEIAVPRGTASFTIGFFDGDARGVDTGGTPHWDQGSPATFSYTLYPDPLRDHSSAIPIPLSGSPSALSNDMPDNAWIDYTVATDPSAQSPGGHYFYRLSIQLLTPAAVMTNAFKVRTGGAVVGGSALFPSPEPFSYIANIGGNADAQIVYPAFPALTPTRYDGTFSFYFDQPVSQSDVVIWDGDFDFGKFDGSIQDTDDPDTPGAPFRPSWATTDAVPEEMGAGLAGATGSPPDDRNPAGAGIYLQKSPSIFYDLVFPDGQTFRNDNPSGNQEWEQFKISTAPFDRSQMDFHTDAVPPGIYQVKMQGVDMQNLNALLLPGRSLCVSEAGSPCVPLHPYLLGDTVFVDANGNGVQDPGEPGIPGVTLELLDERGYPLGTAVTGAAGHYAFDVDSYSYTARVTVPPAGYLATTSEQCQATISTANVLTCDFGYRLPSPAPGTGTLGYWKNHASAWPVESITVGGVTYTKAQAIQWLSTPPRGDVTVSLFQQLIPAKLNVLIGNDGSCVTATIQAADAWLQQYPLGSRVSSSSSAGQTATALQNRLDDYNNGRLCAPHRD